MTMEDRLAEPDERERLILAIADLWMHTDGTIEKDLRDAAKMLRADAEAIRTLTTERNGAIQAANERGERISTLRAEIAALRKDAERYMRMVGLVEYGMDECGIDEPTRKRIFAAAEAHGIALSTQAPKVTP
jgi:hypothetical protein